MFSSYYYTVVSFSLKELKALADAEMLQPLDLEVKLVAYGQNYFKKGIEFRYSFLYITKNSEKPEWPKSREWNSAVQEEESKYSAVL